MARLGVSVGGRVGKLRAVEDPSASILKKLASDLRKISGGAARPSFLLAEAARSECAHSMRARKDSLTVPLIAK